MTGQETDRTTITIVDGVDVQRLSHPARVRHLVQLGRRALTDSAAAAALAPLAHGSLWERQLAIWGELGSGRDEVSSIAITDPAAVLVGSALKVAAQHSSTPTVVAVFADLPGRTRRSLLPRLRSRHRLDAVDACVASLPVAERRPWIGFASPDRARAFLAEDPDFDERATSVVLQRLARRYPDLVEPLLARRAMSLTSTTGRTARELAWRFDVLAEHAPDRALAVLRLVPPRVSLRGLLPGLLASVRPSETVALVFGRGEPEVLREVSARLGRRTDRLGEELCAELVRTDVLSAWTVLAHAAVTDRVTAFDRFEDRLRTNQGILPAPVLALLPDPLRSTLAHEHAGLDELQLEAVPEVLPYLSLLGWTGARAAAATWLADPDPGVRGQAWRAVVEGLRYERSAADDAVTVLAARRNEPSPVAEEIMRALARLPRARWTAAQAAGVLAFVRAALDARDCSPATVATALALVVELAREPVLRSVALEVLPDVLARAGSTREVDPPLPVEVVRDVDAALAPLLAERLGREQFGQVLWLVPLVARSMDAAPACVAALDAVVQRSPDRSHVQQAVGALARCDLALERVDGWLEADPSVGLLVTGLLEARRQDLLTGLLGDRAVPGRFGSPTVRTVPLLHRGDLLPPRLQQVWAEAVLDLLGRPVRHRTVGGYVDALARLNWIGPDALLALAPPERADAADGRVLRDTAIGALGRWRGGDPLPLLIGMLDDDRGRIAVYALRRALATRSPGRALEVLREAPTPRLTVAKEVARLIGELGTDEARDWLLERAAGAVHPDLRLALIRGLWGYLGDDRVWDVLAEAAASDDRVLATAVTGVPVTADRATAGRQDEVWADLVEHPRASVRMAALQRLAREHELAGPRTEEALRRRVLVGEGREQAAATRAWLAGFLLGALDDGRLTLLMAEALEQGSTEAATRLVRAVTAHAATSRLTADELLDALIPALEAAPAWAGVLVRTVAAAGSDELLARLLREQGDDPVTVAALVVGLGQRLRRPGQDDPRLGLFLTDATTAWAAPHVLAWSVRSAWTDGRRAQLAELLAHQDPAVSGWAMTLEEPRTVVRRRYRPPVRRP